MRGWQAPVHRDQRVCRPGGGEDYGEGCRGDCGGEEEVKKENSAMVAGGLSNRQYMRWGSMIFALHGCLYLRLRVRNYQSTRRHFISRYSPFIVFN
jgi:hypothetical protein